jgi:hypothetical protein
MLNIGVWNIHGLNSNKLEDDFFESLHLHYDIVCFIETMAKESLGNLPGYTKPFVSCSKRSKKEAEALVVYCCITNLFYTNSSRLLKKMTFLFG